MLDHWSFHHSFSFQMTMIATITWNSSTSYKVWMTFQKLFFCYICQNVQIYAKIWTHMFMCAFIPSSIFLLTSYVFIWYEFMIVYDNKLFGDFTNYQCFSKPKCSESTQLLCPSWLAILPKCLTEFWGTTLQTPCLLPLIDWSIEQSVDRITETCWEGPLVISNPTSSQSRP